MDGETEMQLLLLLVAVIIQSRATAGEVAANKSSFSSRPDYNSNNTADRQTAQGYSSKTSLTIPAT